MCLGGLTPVYATRLSDFPLECAGSADPPAPRRRTRKGGPAPADPSHHTARCKIVALRASWKAVYGQAAPWRTLDPALCQCFTVMFHVKLVSRRTCCAMSTRQNSGYTTRNVAEWGGMNKILAMAKDS